MIRKRFTAAAAAVLMAAGLGVTLAGSASASPAVTPVTPTILLPAPVTADTTIINRQEIGGGGNIWANFSGMRHLNLTGLGKVTPEDVTANPGLAPFLGDFMYLAVMTDTGHFWDFPGTLRPNQGGTQFGRLLRPIQIQGSVNGSTSWGVFFASTRARPGLVPSLLKGHTENALFPDATWPELAFVPGTTFAGLTIAISSVDFKAMVGTATQEWLDTTLNLKGQLFPGDGQIAGSN